MKNTLLNKKVNIFFFYNIHYFYEKDRKSIRKFYKYIFFEGGILYKNKIIY